MPSSIPRPAAPPLSGWQKVLRGLILGFARRFGMELKDSETGKSLGKALVFPFRGKIHLIGLEAEHPVRIHFVNQVRLTYWKQEIGFRAAQIPDFPMEMSTSHSSVP